MIFQKRTSSSLHLHVLKPEMSRTIRYDYYFQTLKARKPEYICELTLSMKYRIIYNSSIENATYISKAGMLEPPLQHVNYIIKAFLTAEK